MGILHETAVQTRLSGRTLFNGGCYIISWSPGALESSLFQDWFGCVQSANWMPWLLGETKLALWTAEQEPHLTRDGAPDLAKVLVGDAHGSDVLWPSRATPLWVPCRTRSGLSCAG